MSEEATIASVVTCGVTIEAVLSTGGGVGRLAEAATEQLRSVAGRRGFTFAGEAAGAGAFAAAAWLVRVRRGPCF